MITTTALKLIQQIAIETGHTAKTNHETNATTSAGYANGTALIAVVFADLDHADTFRHRIEKLFDRGVLATNGRCCLVSVHKLTTRSRVTSRQVVTIEADAIRVHETQAAKLFDIEPQKPLPRAHHEDLQPIRETLAADTAEFELTA